jgi:hypothetical protein
MKRITDKTFYDITDHQLHNLSMLNLFDIMHDGDDHFLNIFKSYQINKEILNDMFNYQSYDIGNEEWIDQIAHDVYKDFNLWWVILLTNNINNPFEEIESGKNLKLFNSRFISTLIKDIKKQMAIKND